MKSKAIGIFFGHVFLQFPFPLFRAFLINRCLNCTLFDIFMYSWSLGTTWMPNTTVEMLLSSYADRMFY